jgi:hypothetical protein
MHLEEATLIYNILCHTHTQEFYVVLCKNEIYATDLVLL